MGSFEAENGVLGGIRSLKEEEENGCNCESQDGRNKQFQGVLRNPSGEIKIFWLVEEIGMFWSDVMGF